MQFPYLLSVFLILSTILMSARLSADEYTEICDASTAQAINRDMFAVASDEDNILRIYKQGVASPIYSRNMDDFLEVDPEHPEADIEASAQTPVYTYWITSHGNNKNGKYRASRHRLFATKILVHDGQAIIKTVGKPYKELAEDMSQAPQLQHLKLQDALGQDVLGKAPKSGGGFNIEGLSTSPDGSLLIAFRNPIPDGKALIVPLTNPEEVIFGNSAKLGQPITLDLAGQGIRSITYLATTQDYLIISGNYNDGGTFQLYYWSGKAELPPKKINHVDFQRLQPEGLVVYSDSKILAVSDDGSRYIGNKKCKKTNANNRRFRTLWLPI